MKMRAIVVLAALMMTAAIPAFADQASQDQVICNLASKNCQSAAVSIEKRIKKMNAEMKKGKVYSTEDVQKLEQKLKEAQDLLDKMEGKTQGK
jgi:hypothetical protein